MRKFCLLLFLLPFFLILPDRFSPAWIVTDIEGTFVPFDYPEIAQIIVHPLRYLGHGLQSIAFVSADGQYVLKFFLKGKLRRGIRFGLKKSSPPTRIRTDLLHRYNTAFRFMKEETGLLAVHLSTTSQELPFCTVQDSRGRSHSIDLNRASFVVQRCGVPLNQVSPQKAFHALQHLLEIRARKGFTDSKERINPNNFALVDGKAIMIDLGNVVFSEEQKKDPAREVERVKRVLDQWKHQIGKKKADDK